MSYETISLIIGGISFGILFIICFFLEFYKVFNKKFYNNRFHNKVQNEIESYDLYLERLDLIKNEYNEIKSKLDEIKYDIENTSESDVKELRHENDNLLSTLCTINKQFSKLNEQGYYNNKGNIVRDLKKIHEFSEEVLSLIYDLKEKVIINEKKTLKNY